MIRFLLICFILSAMAFATPAVAQDSYGSHSYGGGWSSYGRSGTLRAGIANRRDIRQARREARQASRRARWGGSSGSYGSAGQTSYEAAEPVGEPLIDPVAYCPAEAPALECVDCPTCKRFPALSERRALKFR